MGRQKLNPKILSKLLEIYPERNRGSIQARLSQISSDKGITIGAAAQIMAKQKKRNIWSLLTEEDKKGINGNKIKIIEIKNNNSKSKQKIVNFMRYETGNKFLQKHLEEINRCYTFHCYTATFILVRKVIENLLMEVIKKKFPKSNDKTLYLNFNTGHIRDLSELIKNLRDKSSNFAPDEKKLIQRILDLSTKFKDDANDKTHSLYHISDKSEIDNSNPQQILDLIKEFFNNYKNESEK